MPRAFVTGVTGQDGSYLCQRLTADGVEVHGLTHHGDTGVDDLLALCPGVVLHEGDLLDTDGLAALIDGVEPDEIYNLGGISSVAFSWEHPVLTAQVSGLGALGLLEAAWRLQERTGRAVRVLQASSAEIFGQPTESPQRETTPVRPQSPYGAAKAFAHHAVAVYRARGLGACSVILFNHESPRRPATFVTRKITQAAARIASGQQDSLSLGNLDARRDWGWAPDYVEAMIRAVRHERTDDYVVATGTSHSVRDFVAAAFAHAGLDDWSGYVRVDESLTRPADAVEQVGDAGKAARELGWTPSVPFEQIVARMVDEDLGLSR